MSRILFYILSLFIYLLVPTAQHYSYQDIVVYGGGLAGCAAARNAAAAAPDKKVLLVVPEPVRALGGLGTVGGQNFADIRLWKNELVTQGSFGRWFAESGQFYSTQGLVETIKKDLSQFPNLKVLYSFDLISLDAAGGEIKGLKLAAIERDESGRVVWRNGRRIVMAQIFIDASDDGRLSRLAGAPLTVGRQDWPPEYLPEEERKAGWVRQQAATLMFKVKGIKTPAVPKAIGEWVFTRDAKGSWGLAGGKVTWSTNQVVTGFNEKYQSRGFSVKPINAAQDGAGSEDWWINTLLVYNVDGRAHDRDKNTANYPSETIPGHRTTDQAWVEARDFLLNPDFLNTLRQFKVVEDGQEYGFGEAELVLDRQGKPVVGEIMYIRESVHGQRGEIVIPSDGENIHYDVTTRETQLAGSGPEDGGDRENYPDRIGLGYYMMDINAYLPQDLKFSGKYDWPVTRWLRPDWWERGGEPKNPVYLPYRMLTVKGVKNLLVPGYATGCSSFAWAELRVLPNLAVLGDAAGVAAARAVLYGEDPADFGTLQIRWVQEKLRQFGARLDK
jgi:hypothetical protein